MHTIDQRDPVGKAFTASLLMHSGVVALMIFSGLFNKTISWGDQRASSGAVGINVVPTIPIPRPEGPVNPLANDTKSIVPETPAPVKPKEQVKAPEPDAIPIQPKVEKKKISPQPQSKT